MTARAELLIRGRIVVAARPTGLETAEAIGIADGRVVVVGDWDDVRSSGHAGARVVDAGEAAVIPGLHDFHVHLVGLARSRGAVRLDDARDGHRGRGASGTCRRRGAGRRLDQRWWLERGPAGVRDGRVAGGGRGAAGLPVQPRRPLGMGVGGSAPHGRSRPHDARPRWRADRAGRARPADRHPARGRAGPRGRARVTPAGRAAAGAAGRDPARARRPGHHGRHRGRRLHR